MASSTAGELREQHWQQGVKMENKGSGTSETISREVHTLVDSDSGVVGGGRVAGVALLETLKKQ